MSRAREHLRSNIVGYVALFFVLAGGAYALPGKNTVDSGDIRKGQVKTGDLRNNDVRGADIRRGAVNGSDVGDGSLTGAEIAADSLTDADINAETLTGVDAKSLSGRDVCDVNRRLTVNNSSNLTAEETACAFGPVSFRLRCEATGGGDVVVGRLSVTTSANDTALSSTGVAGTLNAGQSMDLLIVQDFNSNNSPFVSESAAFTVWKFGAEHVVGQAGVRANSLTDNSRTCDFAIFATG